MKIALDVMGGDFAPKTTVAGAIMARKELPDDTGIVLIGDREKIVELTGEEGFDPSSFEIVHTTEVIEMGENPAKAFSNKPDSSIVKGFGLLKAGHIDAFASAGNTGAMMAGSMFVIKSIPGIIRPTISAEIPSLTGTSTLLLDVGINPDCRPDVLYQYGIIGSLYSKYIFKIDNPRVGLLNIGSEEEKGNLLTKSTHDLMKGTKDFSFTGNVEGNDLFSNEKADVIVCDGFVGNVILKEAEAFYNLLKSRKVEDEFFERFNFVNYGGTPILGINKPVIIGHGVSNAIAIKNMIINTKVFTDAKLTEKFKEVFE